MLALGKRTVTGVLSAGGRQFQDWSAAYRMFEMGRIRQTYDDWGHPHLEKMVLKTGTRELRALLQQYTVHPFDEPLGVFFAQARIYDAGDRRFLAVDPYWNAYNRILWQNPFGLLIPDIYAIRQSENLYAYVLNNPLRYVDFSGMLLQIVGMETDRIAAEIIGTYKAEMERLLNMLTSDTIVINADGTVEITERVRRPELRHGTDLIRRVVENATYTAQIILNDIAGYFVETRSRAFYSMYTTGRKISGFGSGSTIYFDPFGCIAVPTVGTDRVVRMESVPMHIALAHELIEAERAMRGVWIQKGNDEGFYFSHRYRVGIRREILGIKFFEYETEVTSRHELAVIGLRFNRSGDITENAIRREQGEPLRGAY